MTGIQPSGGMCEFGQAIEYNEMLSYAAKKLSNTAKRSGLAAYISKILYR
jgi:hypothetical protein